MTGALIITNLTRSDQTATSILNDKRKPDVKLVEQLKYFITKLDNKLESMTDEQAKTTHGILGALRNLAVPSKNLNHSILLFLSYFFSFFHFSFQSKFIS